MIWSRAGGHRSAALGDEELGKRPRFGFEPLRLALGLVERLAQAALGLAGGGRALAGRHDGLFGLLRTASSAIAMSSRNRSMGGESSDDVDERRDVALETLLLGGETGGALHFVADRPFAARRGGR